MSLLAASDAGRACPDAASAALKISEFLFLFKMTNRFLEMMVFHLNGGVLTTCVLRCSVAVEVLRNSSF